MRRPPLGVLVATCLIVGLCLADETAPVGSKQNPIKVYGVEMEIFYCKFLRTPQGEEVEYKRVGSVGEGPYGNILDWYKVKTKDGKHEWDVYIDMYHEDAKALPQIAPPGLLTLQQYTASKLKGKRKNYINGWLPSGSPFCPIAAIYEGRLVVARITPTASGRDINVLASEGGTWINLGDTGNAVTRNPDGYAFLDDLRVGPDNVLWLSSVFTFPYRTYLYRLTENTWKLMGPHEGDRPKSEVIWDSGLHFLGDAAPCRIVETRDEGIQVLRLVGAQWTVAPVTARVKEIAKGSHVWPDHLSRRKRDTWLVWRAEETSGTYLLAACISATAADGLQGPYRLMNLASNVYVQAVAVSPSGMIAANLTDGNYKNGRVHLFVPDGKDAFHSSQCGSVGPNSEFEDMVWGTNDLFAVRCTEPNGVELLILKQQEWTTYQRQEQQPAEGNIGKTRLFVDVEGRAGAMWADWFR